MITATVTINIPIEEYDLLKIVGNETQNSVKAIIENGVHLIILDKKEILLRAAEEDNSKADLIKRGIATVEKE